MNDTNASLLIADDHVLFGEGIISMLRDTYHFLGLVTDGKHVMNAILERNPALVLLDINLPSIDGLELAKLIKSNFSEVSVIFLTMYNEGKFVEQAQKLKVDGYMLKHSTKEELIVAIDKVLSGEKYFDPKLNLEKTNLHQTDYFVKKFLLTPREVEIIRLIKKGASSGQIAEALHLSEETVRSHRKNIHFKLGVSKVSELIEFANANGL